MNLLYFYAFNIGLVEMVKRTVSAGDYCILYSILISQSIWDVSPNLIITAPWLLKAIFKIYFQFKEEILAECFEADKV